MNASSTPNIIAKRMGFKEWSSLTHAQQEHIRDLLPESTFDDLSQYWWIIDDTLLDVRCHNPQALNLYDTLL
jgi:hypothetical protein